MTERPIIFSAESVTAILEGRKTQTRRVIAPQPRGWNQEQGDGNLWLWCVAGDMDFSEVRACRYGRQGDALWVRESGSIATDKSAFMYADFGGALAPTAPPGSESWAREWQACPAIHMPRWASRITLRLTNVRAQRLHDITDADARAEGVTFPSREATFYEGKWVAAYADAWEGINNHRPGCSWADNPWVWALTFEIITPPAARVSVPTVANADDLDKR